MVPVHFLSGLLGLSVGSAGILRVYCRIMALNQTGSPLTLPLGMLVLKQIISDLLLLYWLTSKSSQ